MDNGVSAEDCMKCPYAEPPPEKKKIILKNFLSAGDVLVMSAAIESLFYLYPNDYLVDVKTSCDQIYENNHRITKLDSGEEIDMNYSYGINNCDKRPLHFMEGYCHMLGESLGINLPCTVKTPKIHLSEQEKSWMNQVQENTGYKGRFWILAGDIKHDYTVKMWYGWQEVVDYFHGKIQFVQTGNSDGIDLKNVINLRGKTDLRQLIRLAYHAEGILCLESFANHLAASLNKPCVAICSGFLPPYWISYPKTVILTSFGRLPCCNGTACWKSRVTPLGDGDAKDKSLCELPVFHGDSVVPKCQMMIKPGHVIDAIESFYYGGVCRY